MTKDARTPSPTSYVKSTPVCRRTPRKIGAWFDDLIAHQSFRGAGMRWLDHRLGRAARKPGIFPAVRRNHIMQLLGDRLVIRVSPKSVDGCLGKYVQVTDACTSRCRDWFVLPGEWDLRPLRLQQEPVYRRMQSLIEYRDDYRESPEYKALLLQVGSEKALMIRNGTDVLSSVDTLDAYFERYLEMLKFIETWQHVPNLGPEDQDRHIGVAVGRHGQLVFFQKGHHRIALTQNLDCGLVEAKVLAVHPLWLRERMAQSVLSPLETLVASVRSLDETFGTGPPIWRGCGASGGLTEADAGERRVATTS